MTLNENKYKIKVSTLSLLVAIHIGHLMGEILSTVPPKAYFFREIR